MMKRKEPMEFPLLEVIAFPADEFAISIVVPAEFDVTGEILISLGATMDNLEVAKLLLEQIVNRIADMMFEAKQKEQPPFLVTGSSSTKETASE